VIIVPYDAATGWIVSGGSCMRKQVSMDAAIGACLTRNINSWRAECCSPSARNSCITRRRRGAGITEAAAFLVFFAVFFVGAVVLFLDASILALNKYKLGCITDRAAEYIATEVYFAGAANANFAGPNLEQKTKVLVDRMLRDYGLPASSAVNARVQGRLVIVNVVVPNVKLYQTVNLFPTVATLSDIAAAPIPLTEPPALMSLTYGGQKVFIPVYGSDTNIGRAQFYPWGQHFQADLQLPSGSTYSATP
jgi:hypothetical protein